MVHSFLRVCKGGAVKELTVVRGLRMNRIGERTSVMTMKYSMKYYRLCRK